jgi:hypothetical protein
MNELKMLQDAISLTIKPDNGHEVTIKVDLRDGLVEVRQSPRVEVVNTFPLRGSTTRKETLTAYVHSSPDHQIRPAMRVQISQGEEHAVQPFTKAPQIHVYVDSDEGPGRLFDENKVVFIARGGVLEKELRMGECPLTADRGKRSGSAVLGD